MSSLNCVVTWSCYSSTETMGILASALNWAHARSGDDPSVDVRQRVLAGEWVLTSLQGFEWSILFGPGSIDP